MSQITEIIDDATNPSTKPVFGPLVVSVIDKNGKLIYEHCSGFHIPTNPSKPVTTCSLFPIMSQTKIVTAVATMILVERGTLNLDESVSKYLPEFENLTVINADGTSHTPSKSSPTLRQLLTHSAGLCYYFLHPGLVKWKKENGGMMGLDGTIKPFEAPLIYQPGEGWMYGTGLEWISQVIQVVTCQSFGTFCKENIFTPLQMNDASFHPKKEISDWEERRVPFVNFSEEGLTEGNLPCSFDVAHEMGGYGLVCSPDDFTIFLATLIRGGVGPNDVRILKEQTIEEMFRPQLDDPTFVQSKAESQFGKHMMPRMSQGETFKVNHGISGIIFTEDLKGRRRAGTMHWGGAPNTTWWVDRKSGIACHIMAQMGPQGTPLVSELYESIERAIYSEFIKQ
ncbi:lovD [Acrasis kona]|uniref:LovD n=1 Tax=Acrasis kona TaxID=1008807 RepID=A0AAW2ZK81_9EUKA